MKWRLTCETVLLCSSRRYRSIYLWLLFICLLPQSSSKSKSRSNEEYKLLIVVPRTEQTDKYDLNQWVV